MKDLELLMYSLSKKKEGKALLEWLDDECLRRFGSDDLKNKQQQGKINLRLDLLDMIEAGNTASNSG